MSTIRFTKEHEYIRVEDDIGTIGITDFAQNLLGDITFVELPAIGKTLARGADAARDGEDCMDDDGVAGALRAAAAPITGDAPPFCSSILIASSGVGMSAT